MRDTVSGLNWPVDQPIPFTVTPLALDGIPAPRAACPPWCKSSGHSADYCEGAHADVTTVNGGANFHAYLFQTEGDEPVVAVYSDDNQGTELDLAGLDKLIEDAEAFLPKLRALRQQLADSTRMGGERA